MGCTNCSCGSEGSSAGCGKNGGCSSGSCNKLNTYDWLAGIDLPEHENYNTIEVSFKRGARKEFYNLPDHVHIATGDYVTVEGSSGGYDIGQVSLMGELVKVQMKKKRFKKRAALPSVIRQSNERDLERLNEARAREHETMVQARVIARDLGLEMKVGDVEFQGDQRKVTIYYTADGRVDFRELIRVYAREFRVKIEMRQIGARQESARIGGLGSCGRELCCSTWLTNFRSVSTLAARYQNLAINQSKLSGQCGRLKCCLNYELNTYLDALKDFPRKVDSLETKKGRAQLIKTDIFKRVMYFAFRNDMGASEVHAIPVERVWEVLKMNKKGQKPDALIDRSAASYSSMGDDADNDDVGFVDGTGLTELKQLKTKKRRKSRRRRNKRRSKNKNRSQSNNKDKRSNDNKNSNKDRPPKKRRPRRRRRSNKKNTNESNNKSNKNNKSDK